MRMGYRGFSFSKGSKNNRRRPFDILWHSDKDITGKPILERRAVLERILKATGTLL
jgi:ATP-dependent DNA ligase